jgi:hypothetical protein
MEIVLIASLLYIALPANLLLYVAARNERRRLHTLSREVLVRVARGSW